MKSNLQEQEYFIIFDTNALYHAYVKKADFTSFSFNSTYENVVDFINRLDIYERVVIVIPTVVWEEMKRQIIEAHQLKIKEFREKVAKYHFPEISVKEKADIDYSEYICPIIEKYRQNLSSDINTVIEMPIASETRYRSLLKRAFDKRPPFEGRDKKSDKGFKDALLWESLLEFATQHDTANIIYYSQDNAFRGELQNEFSTNFPNATLSICTTENDVKQHLESWAKEIDIYAYTPIESYVEYKDLIDWLQSGDFLVQVIDRDYGLIEKSRLIMDSSIHLISFENIQITNQSEDSTDYSVDAVLELSYTLKDGLETKERVNVNIIISHALGEIFFVEDMYMSDEVDFENTTIE